MKPPSLQKETRRISYNVSVSNKKPFLQNNSKLALHSGQKACTGKKRQCPQANKCSIICLSQTFRSLWMSAVLSSPPSAPPLHSCLWALATVLKTNSQDTEASVMSLAAKKPRHRRKTLRPINGLTRQISGLAMGQRFKVFNRQESFSQDKLGMLNADQLVWKGLLSWDGC